MINVNQQALLELLKSSLFGAQPSFPEGVDWDAVLQEAKDQTVVALAAPAVPKEVAGKWQIPAAQNKLRFFQILNEQANLIKLFRDADIPLVIIKGFAAAMYYPVPLQRTMGDIDFVVPTELLDEANRLLTESGYTFVSSCLRHNKYTNNDIILELHNRYSDEEWDIEQLIKDGIFRADLCEVYGKQYPALPIEINGVVLLDHIRMHLYTGLGLRQIIDWMMFVHSSLRDDAVWEKRFAPHFRETRLEILAITVTKMCKLWFGLPDEITWCDQADDDLALELLETVFDFGNFGRKSEREVKPVETVTMNIHKYGFFRNLQIAGEYNWKAYHKHKVLRPFAWLYQAFRYLCRGLAVLFRGKQITKEYQSGNKRADFHKRLGIE